MHWFKLPFDLRTKLLSSCEAGLPMAEQSGQAFLAAKQDIDAWIAVSDQGGPGK